MTPIRTLRRRLDRQIEQSKVTIRYGEAEDGALAHYDAKAGEIVIAENVSHRYRVPGPTAVTELFTLAHEFGHHKSHVSRKRHRRSALDWNDPWHALIEEARAWRFAAGILFKVGLRSKKLWKEFGRQADEALATNAYDVETSWWVGQELKRHKVRCPKCRKTKFKVFGQESRRNLTVACVSCRTHTKPRKGGNGIVKILRSGVGWCRCSVFKKGLA